MYLDRAKEHFQKLLQRKKWRDNVRPCTLDQVQDLENHLGLTLPEAYREFLLWTGRGGGFLASEEFDWERVRDDNRTKALAIMQFYNHPKQLSDDAIVFLIYQGHNTFVFICSAEGANPPVHLFLEGEQGSQIVWNCHQSLEAFCLEKIDYLLNAYT